MKILALNLEVLNGEIDVENKNILFFRKHY